MNETSEDIKEVLDNIQCNFEFRINEQDSKKRRQTEYHDALIHINACASKINPNVFDPKLIKNYTNFCVKLLSNIDLQTENECNERFKNRYHDLIQTTTLIQELHNEVTRIQNRIREQYFELIKIHREIWGKMN
jgi:hypothetical protein